MLWPTYSTLSNQLLIFEDLLVSFEHSVWNNYPTKWAQVLICDPQKGATTVFKYYCTAIDCRDTIPCPMFMWPSYPCQQTCQADVAAHECWIICTKDIYGQVSINILDQQSIDTSADTLLISWLTVSQQSTEFRSMHMNWSTLGQLSTNWSSSIDWVSTKLIEYQSRYWLRYWSTVNPRCYVVLMIQPTFLKKYTVCHEGFCLKRYKP